MAAVPLPFHFLLASIAMISASLWTSAARTKLSGKRPWDTSVSRCELCAAVLIQGETCWELTSSVLRPVRIALGLKDNARLATGMRLLLAACEGGLGELARPPCPPVAA